MVDHLSFFGPPQQPPAAKDNATRNSVPLVNGDRELVYHPARIAAIVFGVGAPVNQQTCKREPELLTLSTKLATIHFRFSTY
jgi:hypothetical protein